MKKPQSTIITRDGQFKTDPQTAYLLWLAGGCAIRVEGDKRPVKTEEFH